VSKPVHFDEAAAAVYDNLSADLFAPDVLGPTVDFLCGLAGGGAALEFAIGTGRVGLALSQRGIPVAGIELSPAMIERLVAKPGGDAINVVVGDMTTARVDGQFTLVYLVFNTIMNLTTQDEQVECFLNAATHLEPGGTFVIEVVVPDLRRVPPGSTSHVFTMDPDHVGIEEFRDTTANQIAYSHHWFNAGGRLQTHSAPYRYVWPSELDLMARVAGMTLRERWSDWTRGTFTNESRSHVSVWETRPQP
jgi:hypothetical protein